jgi:DNA-directed RNA polymerase subunit N (RpoN/RPB10)
MPDIEIRCECGKSLSASWGRYNGSIDAEPCPDCMREARNAGDEEGYSRGHAEGVADGENNHREQE